MKIGDRVTLSDKGRKLLNPRSPQRVGVVVGRSREPRCWSVLWDGIRTPYTYWDGFLASPGPRRDANAPPARGRSRRGAIVALRGC